MTKERLEEIRKQKYAEDRVVYTVFAGDKEATALNIVNDNELLMAYLSLDNLFETKEKAEWHNKTYVERTERFEPPMWEDIEGEWNFYFAKGKETYHFWVEKDCVCISKCEYLCDYWSDAHKTLFEEDATKENYIKACEIVRDLFNKGGAK